MMATRKKSDPTTREFQAEVKKLLDIVINSLYTNRDIFVRELISNAADALEKMRRVSLVESDYIEKDLPLEINIDLNKELKTVTVEDTGIGMTEEELTENLGTIAHSGSQEFLKQIEKADDKEARLIGQFGVGFYSVFMVAKRVKVISRSFRPGSPGRVWWSDGVSEYTIEPEEGIRRGTRVILELKDDAEEYVDKDKIKEIIEEYSSFVPFTINLEGKKVNTIQAIWTRSKQDIKDHEYDEFYKYFANTTTEPLYRLHLKADAPIQLNALLYTPQENYEKLLFTRMDPGVNLYCNKVLIEAKSGDILPEYLRFVKGVVDSEDLPLNISRQALQDSRLLAKLKKALTKRYISFLLKEAEENGEKYLTFWKEFGIFIKEGCSEDLENRDELAKLLRYESSKEEPGKYVSLSEYVKRMKDKQHDIFYINGASRDAIESGPYLEMFKARDIEVLYTYEPIDDFVLNGIRKFEEKNLVSADQEKIDLPPLKKDRGKKSEDTIDLSKKEIKHLVTWMMEILGERVSDVKASNRLVDSPAIIVNPDEFMTTGMQRVMQAAQRDFSMMGKKVLEINPDHPVMIELAKASENPSDEEFLKSCVHQIADNALISAGLITDTRSMVTRGYKIMEEALMKAKDSNAQES